MKENLFQKDLYRYYGEGKEGFKSRLFHPLEIKYLSCFRKSQKKHGRLATIYYMLRLNHLSNRTQIQIPVEAQIGAGFYIGHNGRIIINPEVTMGKNINIAPGVTIGQENRGPRKGSPTIGDQCWIGTNAVIVGNIRIGTDVLIAPLTYINFDVPDHSIVIGNPGRIIPKENATESYINRTI